MSAHRTLNDIFRAFDSVGPGRLNDPGDAGTITVEVWGQTCSIVTAGVETRTLAQPTKPGILCAVGMHTDGGTMTLTVTGGYNASADTTLTYDTAGDFAVFYSIDNGGSYYWRPIAGVGSGITELQTEAMDIHALTGLGAVPAATDRLALADESATGDPTLYATVTELLSAAGDMTDLAAAPASDDRLLLTDESAAGDPAKSMTVQHLYNALNAGLASFTGAIVPGTDQILIDDGGVAKRSTVQVLFDGVDDLTALAALPAITDSVLIDDGGTAKKITIQYLFDGINGLTALAAAPDVADTLMIADESVANDPAKTITMQNLFDGIASLGDFTGTVVPATDEVYISDAGTVKACTFQVLMDGLEDLTAAGAGAVVADKLLYLDGGVAENITVQNLFNVSDLTSFTGAVAPTADEIILQDAGTAKACTFQVFMDGMEDLTAAGAGAAVADKLAYLDGGVAENITIQNLFNVTDLTAFSGAIVPGTDRVILQDDGTGKTCTVQVLFDGVNDLTAIGAAPATTDSVLLDDGGTAKKCTVANLHLTYHGTANAAGAGFGDGETLVTSVETNGTIIKTTILFDLTGQESGATADDIIGDDGESAAYLTQITAAVNGAVFAGKMTCLETPAGAGADTDIDLSMASVNTGAEDADVTALTNYNQLINGGAQTTSTIGYIDSGITPDYYLYLSAGTGTAGTYTAGKFMLELWGK